MNERNAPTQLSASSSGRACAGALLLALALGAPRPALAQQEPSAAEVSAARALFLEGLKLADTGRCADAVEKFERAERLHHALTIAARLGECQVELGKLVQGTETLLRVARERLPANAPHAFVTAQARAQKVLDAALPKVAKLKISLKGVSEANAAIVLDGEPVPGAFLDTFRPTDPGAHAIEASAPGFLKESARVTLGDGDSQTVTLTLRPDPNAPKTPPPSATSAGAATTSATPGGVSADPVAEARGPNRLPAYVAFGVGAVGLTAGAVFGLSAVNQRSKLNDVCPERSDCPAASRDDIDAMSRSATFSTIGFGVGVLGLGAGTALLLLSNKPEPTPASATGLRMRAWAGPGSLGLSGTF